MAAHTDVKDSEQCQVRFRCTHCGRDLPAGGTQPCHFCGNVGRDIISVVNERVNVNENRTAILGRLEIHLYYLLSTIGVNMVIPIIYFFLGLADLLSTIISVSAGFLTF